MRSPSTLMRSGSAPMRSRSTPMRSRSTLTRSRSALRTYASTQRPIDLALRRPKTTSFVAIGAVDVLLNAEADGSCGAALENKQDPGRSALRTCSSTQRPIALALRRSKTNSVPGDQRSGPPPRRRGRSLLRCGARKQTRSRAIGTADLLLDAETDRSCGAALENKQDPGRSALRTWSSTLRPTDVASRRSKTRTVRRDQH